jgi:hypothetical protein
VHQVCEVPHDLVDPDTGEVFHLRWRFTWSSTKAAQEAARRAKIVAAGEAALRRLQGLLGKYDSKRRSTIAARIDQALRRAHAPARTPTRTWSRPWTARTPTRRGG